MYDAVGEAYQRTLTDVAAAVRAAVDEDPTFPVWHMQQGFIGGHVAVTSDAMISRDGQYRWSLTRRWSDGPLLVWIMLNPSTANAFTDDPTIRRCIGFAKAWGYGGIYVVNLYALRSTDPKALWQHPDPIGPRNNETIAAAVNHPMVVLAWGSSASSSRAREVIEILRAAAGEKPCRIVALGWTRQGQPRHPLYVRAETQPVDVAR